MRDSIIAGMLEAPIVIKNEHASATIYRHGAHVTAFEPRGQRPVLFLSAKSYYETGKPIRGGVPVIFPWFSTHPTDPNAPIHGVVRLVDWELERSDEREAVFGISA